MVVKIGLATVLDSLPASEVTVLNADDRPVPVATPDASLDEVG